MGPRQSIAHGFREKAHGFTFKKALPLEPGESQLWFSTCLEVKKPMCPGRCCSYGEGILQLILAHRGKLRGGS